MRVYRTFVDRDHYECSPQAGDAAGNIAVLIWRRYDGVEPSQTWEFISPTGATSTASFGTGGFLFPRADGYVWWDWHANTLQDVDGSGRPLCDPAVLPDPTLVTRGPRASLAVLSPWPSRPAGRSWTGVDEQGRVLVLQGSARYETNPIWGKWFDRAGAPLTDAFVVASDIRLGDNSWINMAQVYGGLAVRVGGGPSLLWDHSRWIAIVPSGSTEARPAPEWLTSRPYTSLRRTRGGYALFHEQQLTSACGDRVEILNSAGEACGVLDLVIGSKPCDNVGLLLGLDGTLIQRLPPSREPYDGPDARQKSCTIRYWPAAFP